VTFYVDPIEISRNLVVMEAILDLWPTFDLRAYIKRIDLFKGECGHSKFSKNNKHKSWQKVNIHICQPIFTISCIKKGAISIGINVQ